MVLFAALTHTATIKRPGHTIVSGKKQTSESTVASNVECLITPLGDAAQFTILGQTASESYQAFFPAGTDLQNGDKVVWTDRSLTLKVEGIQERPDIALGDLDVFIEASLKLMHVE